MNKRSAIVVAGGLISAMLAVAVAFSDTLDGGTTTAMSTATAAPIVRTVHRTVTIHKKAKPRTDSGRWIVIVPAPTGAAQTPSSSSTVSPRRPAGGDERDGGGDD